MSFFSGFYTSKTFGRTYDTSKSEAMATAGNIIIALITICLFIFGNKKDKILNIIFFILSITALVIYYILKNKIIEVYAENADENLNKIYFTSSIVIAALYIIINSLLNNI